MTKSELAYKQDTGFYATFNIETDIYVPEDDPAPSEYCCRVDDFPGEYVIDNNVHVPDPAYVRWLEEKVEELIQLKEKL